MSAACIVRKEYNQNMCNKFSSINKRNTITTMNKLENIYIFGKYRYIFLKFKFDDRTIKTIKRQSRVLIDFFSYSYHVMI